MGQLSLTRLFASQHIKDRITELNFSNSKVRITNVDAQSSDDNILIQVLGDIAFSDASPRHFVQSFVLSKQPNGYFVLNDIFRYIKEEVEEDVVAEQEQEQPGKESATSLPEPAPTAVEAKSSGKPADSAADEKSAAAVDDELEKIKADEKDAPAEVNGTSADSDKDEDDEKAAPVAPESEITVSDEDPAADVINEAAASAEKAAQTEKPVQAATSSATPDSSAASSGAPKPAVPKTWARLVATSSTRIATPVLPLQQKPTPAGSQTRATPAADSAPKVSAPASATATAASSVPSAPSPQPAASTKPVDREGSPDSAGWQSVGPDHTRKQSRSQGQTKQEETVRAYIKNVNTITNEELSTALSRFGQLDYVDVDSAKVSARRPSLQSL